MRTYFANTVLVFQLNKYTVLFLAVQSPIFWSHFTLKGPLSGSFSGAYFKFSCLPDNAYRLSCSKDAHASDHAQSFCISSAILNFFCNVGRAGDCIPVTSQPYGSPDSSFKGTRSEWISEWIWIGLRVLDSDNCFIIKKETEILLSTIRELHFFHFIIPKQNVVEPLFAHLHRQLCSYQGDFKATLRRNRHFVPVLLTLWSDPLTAVT